MNVPATEVERINREYAYNPRLRDVILEQFEALYAPATPAPAPARATERPDDGESGLSARQREYNDLRYAALAGGRDVKEAERLARNEIARRHGEPVRLEDMTKSELEASLTPGTLSYDGTREDADDERAAEETARRAAITSEVEAWDAANPGGVDVERGMKNAAARRQVAADADAVSTEAARLRASGYPAEQALAAAQVRVAEDRRATVTGAKVSEADILRHKLGEFTGRDASGNPIIPSPE